MKTVFTVIVVIIMISIILYGAFAFATWELNPKHWDAASRGAFSIVLIVTSLFCGAVAWGKSEIKD